MIRLLWLIPLFPFAGFALNGLLGPRLLPRRWVGWIACGAIALSFAISVGAVVELSGLPTNGDVLVSGHRADTLLEPGLIIEGKARRVTQTLYDWMPLGPGRDGRKVSIAW